MGTTGTYTVTVNATDTTTNETATPITFQVTVQADTQVDPPFLQTINPIVTTAGATNVPFSISAVNPSGAAVTYSATLMSNDYSGTFNTTTGQGGVTTPTAGVYGIQVGVKATNAVGSESTAADTQDVPIYVDPAAPTGIKLLAASDTGSSSSDKLTDLNNTSGKTLQFEVDGVLPGTDVKLFADGTLIGEATASTATGTTSVTITTNGTYTLSDGAHAITATQTLKSQTAKIGNLDTSNQLLASVASSATSITVDTTAPQFTSTAVTSAKVGNAYTYQATATDSSGAVTYDLSQQPNGMTINATSGLINWTPPVTTAATVNVTVEAVDAAGNKGQQQYTITVTGNSPPVITVHTPSLGPIHLNTPGTFKLGSFITNDTTSTTMTVITDANASDTIGIAVTAVTGSGTWQYSLDGTTYQTLTPVSDSSALLLLSNARLRYLPNGSSSDTPSITYRAWDGTMGTNGGQADLSSSSDYGGFTAFSTATDTASITVANITDVTVLSQAAPSLGSTDYNTAKIFNLSDFISTTGAAGETTITTTHSGGVAGAIALTGMTQNGTWAYSTDGGTTYTAVGAVSTSSAPLLPTTAKLRYTPAGTPEVATITYRAWDTTSGTAGTKVDTTTNGGTSAYSLFTDTASLAVTVPNNAPVLTAASPSMGSTNAATAKTINLTDFISTSNATGKTSITDSDSGAVVGGIALTAVTGKGTWAYSLDGTTFTAVGTVSTTSALLLPAAAKLRYTPVGIDPETPTITYCAWDTTSGTAGGLADTTTNGGTTAFSTASDTASLTVNAVAPSGYTITADQGQLTELNAASAGFTFAGATVGTTGSLVTYNYTVTSSGGGTPITGSGTITSATQDITGINVTSLPNGTLTYSVTLSKNGVTGVAATATATLYQATSSVSGYVYLDPANSGQWSASCLGIGGVTVRLFSQDNQGNWTEVASRIAHSDRRQRLVRLPEPACGNLPGSRNDAAGIPRRPVYGGEYGRHRQPHGTSRPAPNAAGHRPGGECLNFAVLGLQASRISLRLFLASTPTGGQLLQSVHVALSISFGSSGAAYSTTLPTDGSGAAIAPATASISSPDSPTIASMTVTITNPQDGAAEVLTSTASNTRVKASFSNGVLTLSGVADLADYVALLQGIKYNDTAAT